MSNSFHELQITPEINCNLTGIKAMAIYLLEFFWNRWPYVAADVMCVMLLNYVR